MATSCESDPVHEYEGKWWFWEETWSDRMGPYDSEEQARTELARYCKEVLGFE